MDGKHGRFPMNAIHAKFAKDESGATAVAAAVTVTRGPSYLPQIADYHFSGGDRLGNVNGSQLLLHLVRNT